MTSEKTKPQLLKYYMNYKGGINNLLVCKITMQYSVLQVFAGKGAEKSANKWINRWNKGLTPNEFTDY